ncbi:MULTISPECIES: hypothetical protein [unclassified Crossiella]|uniref:hypothetical protein n=1 Tax=unclassified Crossiella TaxID=2620835 RepID=UPI001FFE6A55|nr:MULTISPECIES: hypothetical protein [unclassified Crossiella]MCK2243324.1 hypothetical protein [Crossiella sp. S99.2]MCK2254207.1 hypothetical protein [Crossiella sp. S99.1]
MAGRQVDIDFGGGGRFRVEVADLLKMINRFEGVLLMAKEANNLARQTAVDRTPPGEDPFSSQAINTICEKASDADGCHGRANQAYQNEIQKTIDMLQSTYDQYATGEERSRATLDKSKG